MAENTAVRVRALDLKIVFKVEILHQKCRTKALRIAAAKEGVISVSIEGDERDLLVVIGEGIDLIRLGKSLRKKVGHTDLMSAEEVRPQVTIIEEVEPTQNNPERQNPTQISSESEPEEYPRMRNRRKKTKKKPHRSNKKPPTDIPEEKHQYLLIWFKMLRHLIIALFFLFYLLFKSDLRACQVVDRILDEVFGPGFVNICSEVLKIEKE